MMETLILKSRKKTWGLELTQTEIFDSRIGLFEWLPVNKMHG